MRFLQSIRNDQSSIKSFNKFSLSDFNGSLIRLEQNNRFNKSPDSYSSNSRSNKIITTCITITIPTSKIMIASIQTAKHMVGCHTTAQISICSSKMRAQTLMALVRLVIFNYNNQSCILSNKVFLIAHKIIVQKETSHSMTYKVKKKKNQIQR